MKNSKYQIKHKTHKNQMLQNHLHIHLKQQSHLPADKQLLPIPTTEIQDVTNEPHQNYRCKCQGDVTRWQVDNQKIRWSDNLTIWQSDNLTIWQSNNLTNCQTETRVKSASTDQQSYETNDNFESQSMQLFLQLFRLFKECHIVKKQMIFVIQMFQKKYI